MNVKFFLVPQFKCTQIHTAFIHHAIIRNPLCLHRERKREKLERKEFAGIADE